MLIQLIVAILLGILTGTFTGLIPGIHINLVAALLITSAAITLPQEILIVFIVSLAITHTFIDFIPSIYLGASSEDTITSILPGHKLLLSGEGSRAIDLTLIGSTIAVISLIIIIPLIFLIVKTSYIYIQNMMGFILIVVLITLISQDKNSKKLTLIVFFLSGLLGTISLNSNVEQPLLPLLTGLFGSSTLISSIYTKTKVPKQKITKLKFKKKELIKPTLLTMLVSPFCSFLPGLGASQAASLSSTISKKQSTEEFLILLGSINTLIIATSFVTLYLTNKTRTGASSAISEITNLTPQLLILIIATILITTLIAFPITFFTSRFIAKRIHKINYSKISITILVVLTIGIFAITRSQGLLIYITATALGLFTINTNTRRSHLMGAILLPTTLYYLPF